jgi:adenosylhomocysteine nucleosidase
VGHVILAACGLRREAGIVAQPGWHVIAGGGDAARLDADLDSYANRALAIISIGLCGALCPQLPVGSVVIGSSSNGLPTDMAWRGRIAVALPAARIGGILGSAAVVATAAAKAAAFRDTGAIAVDMESQVAAAVAARHGLPLAIVRVVSDAAHSPLPPAARAGMRADGGVDLPAVLRSIARQPAQLPALFATGIAAARAFRTLARIARLLPGPIARL